MLRVLIITTACLGAAFGCFGQDIDHPPAQDEIMREIPAGTRIAVRTDDPIDVRDRSDGRIFHGTIAEDVLAPNSDRVLIPRGARAELIVQNVGDHQLAIDIDSISVEGRRYMVSAQIYGDSRRTNPHTGAYVGGGAVFGTILGAIAGGGKGAAIGALAGAAAGGSAAILTRGASVHIPAESVLDFQLAQPLEVATGRFTQDNGYDDQGYHYHNGYYNREGGR